MQLKNLVMQNDDSPEGYHIYSPGLGEAVSLAIMLRKPLLITGSPGTGKTQLASKVVSDLAATNPRNDGFAPFYPRVFKFSTKTTSVASDLFYTYDAVGHFRSQGKPAEEFITLSAFGKAIMQTHGSGAHSIRLMGMEEIQPEIMGSVVLIDEIDKAPRDFPNDLLNEMEKYEFTIRELNKPVTVASNEIETGLDGKKMFKNPLPRILVIMTSNFEKNLPDAFMRRCLFYHIQDPDKQQMRAIVESRLGTDFMTAPQISKLIDDFFRIRDISVEKVPSTAEFLEWVKVLGISDFFKDVKDVESIDFNRLDNHQAKKYMDALTVLTKNKSDREKIINASHLSGNKS